MQSHLHQHADAPEQNDLFAQVAEAIRRVTQCISVDRHGPTMLIDDGVLDSLSIVNLVLELECALGISIPDVDITEENFRTTRNVTALCVARRTSALATPDRAMKERPGRGKPSPEAGC